MEQRLHLAFKSLLPPRLQKLHQQLPIPRSSKTSRIIDSFEPLLPPDQNVISAEGALRIPMTYDNQSHPNLTYIIEDDLS